MPSEEDRLDILKVLTKSMRIRDKEVLLTSMSNLTPGYVPADLATLCKEASI